MEIEIKVTRPHVEDIFSRVSIKRYKKDIKFSLLTAELSKLKKGGCLKYEHLEMIADRSIWPFSTWWRWPAREQISDDLSRTEGLFKRLAGLPDIHENRRETEKGIFNILYDIFKHLELVSILLRFIDEDNYAICSPPVLHILNSPRGESYENEYFNYLKEIRKYKNIYELEKVAYVDMFLWAIEVLGEEREEILEIFHGNIENNVRKSIVSEIIKKEVMKKTDLQKAIFYFDVGEYATAAKWAGCAYETVFQIKCLYHKIQLLHYDRKPKTLGELVKEYPCSSKTKLAQLHRIVDLRNYASHPSSYEFGSDDVSFLIKATEELQSGIQ
jgi:hypothetical protein